MIDNNNKITINGLDKLTSLQQLTFGYDFNKPLSNSLDKLISLRRLTFGDEFNKPLSNSLDKLTSLQYLSFGGCFNRPLSNSLDKLISLQYLTFGEEFNKPLTNSLAKLTSLEQLTLDCLFDQQLDLPSNIKYLVLDCNNQYIIDNLHNNIEELTLSYGFDLELNNLPSSIKKIIFDNQNYDKELNNLPSSVEYIRLPIFYKKKILNIPKNLKEINCSENYEFINDFSNCQVSLLIEY
jgi:hypothetical protein